MVRCFQKSELNFYCRKWGQAIPPGCSASSSTFELHPNSSFHFSTFLWSFSNPNLQFSTLLLPKLPFYHFHIYGICARISSCAKILCTILINHPVPNSFQMFFFAPQNCVLCLFLNIFPVLYSGKGLPWIAWNLQSISTLPFRGWSQTKCFVHLCESVSTLM